MIDALHKSGVMGVVGEKVLEITGKYPVFGDGNVAVQQERMI